MSPCEVSCAAKAGCSSTVIREFMPVNTENAVRPFAFGKPSEDDLPYTTGRLRVGSAPNALSWRNRNTGRAYRCRDASPSQPEWFPVFRNLEGRRFPPELSRCAQEHTEVVGIRTHRIGLESPLSEVITEPRAQVLQCVNGELFEGDVQES